MTALENSLSFALTVNETLAKRLNEVEQRAQQAEEGFIQCTQRLAALEEHHEQAQQKELQDWLIFSGTALSRLLSRSRRAEDAAQLLQDMVKNLMEYDMDMRQIGEVQRAENQIRVRFNVVAAGSDRFFLVRNKTRLRGSGLYIRERLTPYRQRIFSELMQLKRDKRVSTVFTREGTVFVVVNQRDRPRPVRSDVALDRLVRHLAELGVNH